MMPTTILNGRWKGDIENTGEISGDDETFRRALHDAVGDVLVLELITVPVAVDRYPLSIRPRPSELRVTIRRPLNFQMRLTGHDIRAVGRLKRHAFVGRLGVGLQIDDDMTSLVDADERWRNGANSLRALGLPLHH